MTTTTSTPFVIGKPVGPSRVWGEVAAEDRFVLPTGETLTVKSRTKRYVSFYGSRYIDANINVVYTLHPEAVYLGKAEAR